MTRLDSKANFAAAATRPYSSVHLPGVKLSASFKQVVKQTDSRSLLEDQEFHRTVNAEYIWPALPGPVWPCHGVCIMRCLSGRFQATIILVPGKN